MDERIVKIVREARKSLDEKKSVENSQSMFRGFRNLRANTKIRFLPLGKLLNTEVVPKVDVWIKK